MISVLIPTKGRPKRLKQCVNSIDADCEILVLATTESDVDFDDTRMSVSFNPDLSVVQAQNYLASIAEFDLVPTCDDVEYYPGALQNAQKMLNQKFSGNGVIGFSVTNMKCNDDAFMMVGRQWYDCYGLFNPAYEHFYADTELGNKAKSAGKFSICPNAKMKNYHPFVTGQEDETHRFRRAEKLAHDEQVYRSRILHR